MLIHSFIMIPTVWTEITENLKKYDLLTYSLTDNLKARDASASKNPNLKPSTLIFAVKPIG